MYTPHRSSLFSFKSFLLSLACISSVPQPVHAFEWERDQYAVYSGVASLTCVVVAYVMLRSSLSAESADRKEVVSALQDQLYTLDRALTHLQRKYDELPITKFENEANRKIEQVRSFLQKDLDAYKVVLAEKMQRIHEEIARLESTRDEIQAVLNDQRAHFDEAKAFIESVHDNEGNAYLNDIVAAKRNVEQLIDMLHVQHKSLARELTGLQDQAAKQSHILDEQYNNITATNNTLTQLNNLVAQEQRNVNDLVNRAKNTLSHASTACASADQARKEVRTASENIHSALVGLESVINSANNQSESLRTQAQAAHDQLQAVKTAIAKLSHSISQSTTRSQQSSVSQNLSQDSYSSQYSSSHNSYQKPKASPQSDDALVVTSAVAALHAALNQFASSSLSDVSSYRRAYRKFSLKNHPDRGGNTAVFQAVDGLFKLLEEHNLFDRVPSYLSASVRADIIRRTHEIKSVLTQIRS